MFQFTGKYGVAFYSGIGKCVLLVVENVKLGKHYNAISKERQI